MLNPYSLLRCRGLVFIASGFAVALLGLSLAGCRKHGHNSDPRFARIEETLDAELPPGTSLGRVTFYLDARGYQYQVDEKGKKVVAVIQKVDEKTLTHVVAQVEFQFDNGDRLVSYDLQSLPSGP